MSELQQRKKPWYTEDFLYIIAEKLLARIPKGWPQIDFREQNPYRWFMGHNEMAFRSIISQFAKFKRIHFYRDYFVEQIKFYKKEKFNDQNWAEFGGPYIVLPGMLEYIIEKGKFRVNTIKSVGFLPDAHSIDIKEFGEINSLKAFCALFLGKQNNFEAILAIDAVELEFSNDYDNIIIDCSQYKSSIIANNTMKITVNCCFDFRSSEEDLDKFATKFKTFCSFLVRVCPNLKHLQIKIRQQKHFKQYTNTSEFFDNFHSIIKAMEASIKSINNGNEHLQISICLIVFCHLFIGDFHHNINLPLLQSHDLSKLGTPLTIEHIAYPHIARSLECVDAQGRTHKLQFKAIENWWHFSKEGTF